MTRKRTYVISYDIGSTSNKTCLYEINEGINLVGEASEKYFMEFTAEGGVEQNPHDWWDSMRKNTAAVLSAAQVEPHMVEAISFCSQMQGLVLIDEQGQVLRPAMSYMDKRAVKEFEDWTSGLFTIAHMNARRTLVSLLETGVTAGSAKDPVFRYRWVKGNEPQIFRKIHKWLDVKDYLIYRCTGNITASRDSAFATMLYSEKNNHWGHRVCGLHGVDMNHLPPIVECTDMVGRLSGSGARELGLHEKCKVFSGGGDSTLIGVGAGSTKVGDTHMYIGTSGWVSTVVDKPMVDITSMIASVVGAQSGRYNYFAEMETSGKAIDWVRDNVIMDGIGLYGNEISGDSGVIDRMSKVAADVPPGSNGVIFTPWLLGNRCPFEDADARGGFFNISLTTAKADMIRAVFEGILFHKRWMLERQSAKIKTSSVIRLVGGGAKSDLICQILADMTGCTVERTAKPQNAGALGAAILMAHGLGYIESLDEARGFVNLDGCFTPDPGKKQTYEKNYAVFKRLHRKNKKNFRMVNK